MLISVINHSSRVSDAELLRVIRSINRQLKEDFKPRWHIEAELRLEGRSASVPDLDEPTDMRGSAILYLKDEADVEGALGYHDLNHRDIPFGVVFTELSAELGEEWSVTLSHETLELALDPGANSFVRGPDPRDSSRLVLHWREACDAVQAQSYDIDGVAVSNFVLPSYFTEGEAFDGRNDFLGQADGDEPLASFGVTRGGYVGYMDPETGESNTFVADGDAHASKRMDIKYRAKGARRAMRYMASHGEAEEGQLDAITIELADGACAEDAQAHADAVVASVLGDWSVTAVPGTNNEFDVASELASALTPPQCWDLVHRLLEHADVAHAEPLFLEAAHEIEDELADTSGHDGRGRRASSRGGKHLPATNENYDWSLRTVNARAAWAVLRAKGRTLGGDIRIAHPDSGYRDHSELADALDLSVAWDFIGHDPLPREDDADGNHGLSTGSVIVSRDNHQASRATVTGTAPAAHLVPLRVVKRKLGIGATPAMFPKAARRLRDAIRHAVKHDCHVISMSIGTKFNIRSLRKALDEAAEAGVIVLAAAGNAVWPIINKKVIYPARYSSVIAVAACNIDDKPWKRSARGKEVDITAPGESVWRAVVKKGNPVVLRSSGTSYAVATVAGLAALWLSYHGRDALLQRYTSADGSRRGLVDAFRKALKMSARPGHPSLSPAKFGAGIVDAVQLLEADLDADEVDAPTAPSPLLAAATPRDLIHDLFPDVSEDQLDRGLRAMGHADSGKPMPGASPGARRRSRAPRAAATVPLQELAHILELDSRAASDFLEACQPEPRSGDGPRAGALHERCRRLGSTKMGVDLASVILDQSLALAHRGLKVSPEVTLPQAPKRDSKKGKKLKSDTETE